MVLNIYVHMYILIVCPPNICLRDTKQTDTKILPKHAMLFIKLAFVPKWLFK